jgi:kynurenine formamidase
MKAQIVINDRTYTIDLNQPSADLSMAVSDVARAWYIIAPTFKPVVLGDWKGSVALGGAVNFFNISFNPHAHGTHTETAGHITKERHSINTNFKNPYTKSVLLTVTPVQGVVTFDDFLVQWEKASSKNWLDQTESVILRTEQHEGSLLRDYSNTDWPFLASEIGAFLRSSGIDHLIIDQPSVDQEEDGGALACHRSFWGATPLESLHRTITELAHIPIEVIDGVYLLNLQVAPLENDAAPSRPILYRLI